MFGFRISIGNVLAAALFTIVAVWVFAATAGTWYSWVLLTLLSLLAVSCVLTVRGATAWEWVYRRAHVGKPLTRAGMTSVNGRAAVWDGKAAKMSMFIEVFGQPWEVAKVHPNGDLDCSTVPLQSLAGMLRQFGITLDHIRVVNYGHKTATDDRACTAVAGVIGTVPYLLGGRVFLELSVRMGENWNAVYARMPHERDTVSDGLCRVVSIVADRALRVFENYDINARVMSPAAVSGVTAELVSALGAPVRHPSWRYDGVSGDNAVGAAATFTPTSFSPSVRRVMGEVVSRRQYYCTTLSTSTDTDRVNQSVTYLVDGVGSLDLLSGQGLRRDNGHHTARISHIIPRANDMNVDSDGVPATEEALGELVIPTHGLGVYLGQERSRDRVFVYPGRGGDALWVIGNDTLARRLALRSSTLGLRTVTCVDTDDWHHLVTTRKSRFLVKDDNPSVSLFTTDILFVTPEQYATLGEHTGNDAAAIVVVADDYPPVSPTACIVPHETDPDLAVLVVGKETHDFVLDAPPNERSWIEP